MLGFLLLSAFEKFKPKIPGARLAPKIRVNEENR